jgi:hypothetical protein
VAILGELFGQLVELPGGGHLDMLLSDDDLQEGFTGVIPDSLGRMIRFEDGKRVPLHGDEESSKPRGKSTAVAKPKKKKSKKTKLTKEQRAQKLAERAREIVHTITPTTERAYKGGPKDPNVKHISKQLAGAIGEEIVIKYYKSLGFTDAQHTNTFLQTTRTNLAMDLVHDHELLEVKTGQTFTGSDGVWALTFNGKLTKAQERRIAKLSPEDAALARQRIRAKKRRGIFKRKEAFIQEVQARLGDKAPRPKMVTLILDPEKQIADIYVFDGIHERIAYNSKQAEQGYVASVKYGG